MPGTSLRNRKRPRNNEGPETEEPPASAASSNSNVYELAEGELMHSTSKASAGKRVWLRMLSCLERQSGYTYVSCDGSSSGWHACVVAVGEQLHLRARWADMQVNRQLVLSSTRISLTTTRRARATSALKPARMLSVSPACCRCNHAAAALYSSATFSTLWLSTALLQTAITLSSCPYMRALKPRLHSVLNRPTS